jgi:hypothetical protein
VRGFRVCSWAMCDSRSLSRRTLKGVFRKEQWNYSLALAPCHQWACAAGARNLQPLRFCLSHSQGTVNSIKYWRVVSWCERDATHILECEPFFGAVSVAPFVHTWSDHTFSTIAKNPRALFFLFSIYFPVNCNFLNIFPLHCTAKITPSDSLKK